MSSFDPLALLASKAIADAQASIAEATLSIGASAEVLKQQINVGDLIEAVVLPPQNGSDRLSIFGQTVVAQLPPGVHPGESLVLQVTGFSGQQIIVRNLGAIDPKNLPATVEVVIPEQPEGSATSAVLTVVSRATPAAPAPPPAPLDPTSVNIAPPRAVFVAASVLPTTAAEKIPAPATVVAAKNAGAAAARLAFARTAARTTNGAPVAQRIAVPPQTPRPGPVTPTPQAALLTRLRVPISATTLVAARLIDDAAEHVTRSYQRLDGALAKLALPDSRVGALRALVAFAGKFDLRNARSLSAQIEAFVTHVVEGAESKLASIVREFASAPDAPLAAPARNAPFPTAIVSLPPDSAARVVERNVALEHDVKATILSLLQGGGRALGAQTTQALGSALSATTALQLNVLSAQSNDPNTIAIPLPAYFYDGGKPTQLRISRDAGKPGSRMNADNFSVAFVLDTKTLGTIAIDLQTVGRAVSVTVKTEQASAATRFRDTLAELRGRLESLRYRVASMVADVAPSTAAAPASSSAPEPVPEPARNVDMRA